MLRNLTTTAYIALGSNVGNREQYLRGAVRALDAAGGNNVVTCSPVYETEAMVREGDSQSPYLNAVIELSTQLTPHSLLVLCHEIELAAGRVRDDRQWAPRTLDIDILLFGQDQVSTPVLTIPHPRLTSRRFVLQPLADIAPDLMLPKPINTTVTEALAECEDSLRIVPYEDVFVSDRDDGAMLFTPVGTGKQTL